MQHAIVVFRIKWVWIWLRLSGTRVPSRGAFFGRKDYPRSQKKKNGQKAGAAGRQTGDAASAVQPIQISSRHGPHARVKAGSFFNHPGVPGGPVFLPGNKVDH